MKRKRFMDRVIVQYGPVAFEFENVDYYEHKTLALHSIVIDTIPASVASLGKWEAIVLVLDQFPDYLVVNGGSDTCALCQNYGGRLGCLLCPIFKTTLAPGCADTPYLDFLAAFGMYHSHDLQLQYARQLVRFLQERLIKKDETVYTAQIIEEGL